MKLLEHFPKVLLLLLFSKYLILGFDITSCISLGIIVLFNILMDYKPKNKEIEDLKNKISKLEESEKKINDTLERLNTNIMGIKMTSGIKTTKF
jgi:hypothetical protein